MVKNREMYSLANNELGVNVEQVKINELYALKGTLLKSKEIRNSLNFVEASKQKESLFHYWYETVHMEEI